MTLDAAEQLARRLMHEHGLIEAGWLLRWSSAKRQLGAARIQHRRRPGSRQVEQIKTIRLSRHLVRLNDEAEVRDTILHEIAHALAGLDNGHNEKWKAVCRQIGAKPERLAGEHIATPRGRYHLVCHHCQRVLAHRHRRMDPRRLKQTYCRACGPISKGKLSLHDTRTPAVVAP